MIFHPSTLASFLPSLSHTFVHAFIYSCINHHEWINAPWLPACMYIRYIVTSCPFHSIYQPINPYIHLSFHRSFAQLGSLQTCQDLTGSLSSAKTELSEEVERHYQALQEAPTRVWTWTSTGWAFVHLATFVEEYFINLEIPEKMQGDWGLTGFSRPETKNRHWTSSLRSQTIANSCLYSSPVSCFWRHRPPGHASWRPVYRRRVLPKTTGVQREDRMPSFGMIWLF